MTDALLHTRPAESALYGCPIVSASATSLVEAQQVVKAFRDGSASLLVLRVPATAAEAIHFVEQGGGQLCDVLVSYALPSARWGSVQPEALARVSAASPAAPDVHTAGNADGDIEALADIAGDAFEVGTSHWHADPRTAARAAELYRRWARDLTRATDATRPIMVASRDNRPLAFVAIEPVREATWRVPLAAVAPQAQGQGLLRLLLLAAIGHLRNRPDGELVYETQLTNMPATRAVASLGFRLVGSQLTFHLWNHA